MEPGQTRRCGRCDKTRGIDAFSKRGRGGYQAWCKPCMNDYAKTRVRAARGLPADAPLMRGKRDGHPLGARVVHRRSGYVMIKAPGHHRADRWGWAPEHIVIAEAKYGVQITRGFTVHHVNGDRADNRPENLELRVGNHGKGATLIPGLLRDPAARAVARQVLAQYDD